MTSKEASWKIENYLTNKGFACNRGSKNSYFTHPNGKQRYMITSRTIKRQIKSSMSGWVSMPAVSLITAAEKLKEKLEGI